jgi:4-oxalocrotonate tautomerase
MKQPSQYLSSSKLKLKGGLFMPLVQVKVIEGVFSDSQKKAMIEKLTDAMVAIEGENMRQVTWVTIEDVRSGEWGIGGKALTTEAVKSLAAGK